MPVELQAKYVMLLIEGADPLKLPCVASLRKQFIRSHKWSKKTRKAARLMRREKQTERTMTIFPSYF